MARTIAQVLETARGILQDATGVGGFRYTDNELVRYVTEGLTEMRRLRPDVFLTYGLDVAIPVYTTANLTENLPVSDSYFTPLVNFVVGRAELRDDEFTNDSRAATLLNSYNLALTSNGGKR